MTPKHQFEGTSTPRTFYDRQVRKVGGTRYVALGRVMPSGWTFVRIRKVELVKDTLTVSFEKLAEEIHDASDSKVHKKYKQDTPKSRTAHSSESVGSES